MAQDASTDVGSQAQLGMIQLQSLMSQRQMAIQMCTNLIQALNSSEINNLVPAHHQLIMMRELIHLAWI